MTVATKVNLSKKLISAANTFHFQSKLCTEKPSNLTNAYLTVTSNSEDLITIPVVLPNLRFHDEKDPESGKLTGGVSAASNQFAQSFKFPDCELQRKRMKRLVLKDKKGKILAEGSL